VRHASPLAIASAFSFDSHGTTIERASKRLIELTSGVIHGGKSFAAAEVAMTVKREKVINEFFIMTFQLSCNLII
jgi:hypothetical protein